MPQTKIYFSSSATCQNELPFGQIVGIAPNEMYFCWPKTLHGEPSAKCAECQITATSNCDSYGNVSWFDILVLSLEEQYFLYRPMSHDKIKLIF